MISPNKIPNNIVEKLKDVVWEYPYKLIRPNYPYSADGSVEVDKNEKKPIPGVMLSVGNNAHTKNLKREDLLAKWFDIMGPEMKKWLEDNLQPYGGDIRWIRANIYGTGSSLSLHTDSMTMFKFDDIFSKEKEGDKFYLTHAITLDRSDDIEGGYTVLSDLIMLELLYRKETNLSKTPLKVYDTQIGDCVTWDNLLLHGVSEIISGSRVTISIDKNL